MKKLIKSLIPPILLHKLKYLKNYKYFLKYKNLIVKNSKLKDKHKGQRCFILGSGPSIKKENLKPLKDEVVFALNNFYIHEDFVEIMNGDAEKYYMTAPIHLPQSEEDWRLWFEDMQTYIPNDTNMLLGLDTYNGNIKYIFDKYSIFKNYNLNWYFSGVSTDEYYSFNRKDIDIVQMVWSAHTVSIYALIVAIYMGFDEIYLLGMDHNFVCNSEDKWRFYKNAIHQKAEVKRATKEKSHTQHELLYTGKIFEHYQLLKNNNKTKIYNCSSDSLLDIFEYKQLAKIIKA